jgi:hypothetical protein
MHRRRADIRPAMDANAAERLHSGSLVKVSHG